MTKVRALVMRSAQGAENTWVKREKIRESEQSFWNEAARRSGLERDTHNSYKTIQEDIWFGKLIELLGKVRGKRILDCGFALGHLGVFLAAKDASIHGFDISSEMVKVARANAQRNGTNEKCNFLCCSFEDLAYRDISFDLAVGSYVLHHVDIERAVKELCRVLKPGGRAIFIETWGRNPLLLLARKYLVGKLGIAKYGTEDEHPITQKDIREMERVFSEVRLYFPEFVFFKKAGTNIFRWKKSTRIITDVLVRMDNFVTHRFPIFNQYGYRCIITLLKK